MACLRPAVHFLCPEGIHGPFDPNGAIFWKGRYHLFYIYQKPRREIGHGIVHCWGHASSTDLVHWERHPTPAAFDPPEQEPGQFHIFSGGAFLDRDGRPAIIYHGVGKGTCIAVPEDDDLLEWRNLPENPVIPEPRGPGDPGWGVYNVFDPHAWYEDGWYYTILGGQVKPADDYDTVYLFRSRDLVHWEYRQPFYQPNPQWTGPEEDCACPDFFRLGDRWVLCCISHPRGARYYLGRYEDERFIPEEHHRMNWPGGSCFATESLADDRGRRVMWAWVMDQRPENREGFGVLSLPRVLSLDAQGQLLIEPPEELAQLRGDERTAEFTAGGETVLPGIAGDCLELEVEATVPADGTFALTVCRAPDGAEATAIRVDRAAGTLSIDTRQASLDAGVRRPYPIFRGRTDSRDVPVQTAPFALAPTEPLRLRVFVDRSIVEIFANRRQCVTQRIYPTRADSIGVAVAGAAGTVRAWTMGSVS